MELVGLLHMTVPPLRRTFATPLKRVLSSLFQPASFKLLTSHSGLHPSGKKALASAATSNLPSTMVQKSGLMP